MAELTPEERQKIYEEEKARLEARKHIEEQEESEKERKKTLGCLGVIGIIVFIFVIFYVANRNHSSVSHSEGSLSYKKESVAPPTGEEEKMIRDMIEAKLIDKINPELNAVYVDPVIWAGIKYDRKEAMCRFLAIYCGKKKGTGLNWVEIYDSYSGKKLAKYDSWGFKVY
jgi:hypothetical protein